MQARRLEASIDRIDADLHHLQGRQLPPRLGSAAHGDAGDTAAPQLQPTQQRQHARRATVSAFNGGVPLGPPAHGKAQACSSARPAAPLAPAEAQRGNVTHVPAKPRVPRLSRRATQGLRRNARCARPPAPAQQPACSSVQHGAPASDGAVYGARAGRPHSEALVAWPRGGVVSDGLAHRTWTQALAAVASCTPHAAHMLAADPLMAQMHAAYMGQGVDTAVAPTVPGPAMPQVWHPHQPWMRHPSQVVALAPEAGWHGMPHGKVAAHAYGDLVG